MKISLPLVTATAAQAASRLSLRASINGTQIEAGQPTCRDLTVETHVTKTTQEDFLSESYSVRILDALSEKRILVSGSYNLSARFCAGVGESASQKEDTLQILIHGASFNKIMWDFPYQRERYSWVKRMNEEGYSTLAVDMIGKLTRQFDISDASRSRSEAKELSLIGYGNSTYPDGLLEAQTQTYVETLHQLIQKLRSGEVDGKKWTKIVFVGFSIGAITANSLANQYAADVDAIVLHGFSWDTSWIYPAFLSGLQVPARQIEPEKWGHIPATYQTQSTREGRKAACFSGSYDPDILEYDWQYRDFDSVGAAITLTFHQEVAAPDFKGPVFLGIGKDDSTFCGGQVCNGAPYAIYDKFVGASAHEVRVYEETGHLILLHNSGVRLINDTLAFLGRVNI